jgi:hypothetical protein
LNLLFAFRSAVIWRLLRFFGCPSPFVAPSFTVKCHDIVYRRCRHILYPLASVLAGVFSMGNAKGASRATVAFSTAPARHHQCPRPAALQIDLANEPEPVALSNFLSSRSTRTRRFASASHTNHRCASSLSIPCELKRCTSLPAGFQRSRFPCLHCDPKVRGINCSTTQRPAIPQPTN